MLSNTARAWRSRNELESSLPEYVYEDESPKSQQFQQPAHFLQLSEGVIMSRERRRLENRGGERQREWARRRWGQKTLVNSHTLQEKRIERERNYFVEVFPGMLGSVPKTNSKLEEDVQHSELMQLSLLFVGGRSSRMVLSLPLPLQLLLVALLLNTMPCHAELRARDPDVAEGPTAGLGGWPQQQAPGIFRAAHWPIPHGHHGTGRALQPPMGTSTWPMLPSSGSSHQPTKMGQWPGVISPLSSSSRAVFSPSRNWCAFVQRRVLTVAVLCGTEKFQMKSVTPCPGHDPECQMTNLHALCPVGVRTEADLLEGAGWENSLGQDSPRGPSLPAPALFGIGGATRPSTPLPIMDSASLLMVHQGFAAMMTHLQPVLDTFNHSLARLSSEVEAISTDLQKLKQNQENNVSHSGTIEEKLADSFEQIRQMQAQLNLQEKHMEQTMQSQQDLLQHNLTNLKNDIDHHINQNYEDIQGNLQYLTASVEEIRLSQERLEELTQGERPLSGPTGSQPAPMSNAWEAISSLDEKVLNNNMQLRALSVNSRHFVSFTQNLEHGLQNLSQILDQVHQDSEVRFAEAGLEVEAVRVAALNSINEVAANLSMQANQLRELELYMDSFYQHLQSNEPTTAEETCRCKEISKSLVRLEQEIANVTDLARENRYALEDEEAKKGQGDWPVELEDLNQGLLSVKESLAFEQAKSRALNDNVSQLKALLLGSQKEIFEFKECVVAKSAEIRHLSESFSSLLKDATRHADVLEVLIGDEVMEFLSWSSSQQQELSIPILLQKMQLLQEKIESHESRLASVRRKREERDHMNTDILGAFSEQSLIKEQGTAAADERDSLAEAFVRQLDRDYSASNIWSLGRKMEELAERLSQLEEQHHNCTAAPSGDMVELQGEVVSLRQALEDHLRTFQNLFTYTEELSSSPHSLKLDQLWTEINRKDRKRKDKMEARSNLRKEPKRTGKYPFCSVQNENESVKHECNLCIICVRCLNALLWTTLRLQNDKANQKIHSQTSYIQPPPPANIVLHTISYSASKGPSYSSVAFIAGLDDRTSRRGTLLFQKVTLNHGNAYSPSSGAFGAPQTGVYLFLVTLDFEKGPCLVRLMRDAVPAATFRQEQGQGELRSRAFLLELRKGERVMLELLKGTVGQRQPNENTLSGILLFSTEDTDYKQDWIPEGATKTQCYCNRISDPSKREVLCSTAPPTVVTVS
ncbi:hypothetical protein P4O66_011027 [Electrophorus voltai]|uniref:C1q domain-containing protein n=1 Tax=Electrophorus voltai TaxID=2609070 RepID=A0AAD8Z761_9TELE|nr:hypothetical protein P4O66_011027 [Electrophorus voltai]